MTDNNPKTWFITGCDTGMGRATAAAALARGDRVIVTVLAPDGRSDLTDAYPDHCRAFHLNVKDHVAVRDVVAKAEQAFGGIDVLVNNAGYGLVGAAEETVADEYRPLFEVNFFGLVEVTRAVLAGMRQRRSGHIINFSSMVGFIGMAGFSFYSASKFAVEGYSESLAKEVKPLGIHITIIEPGSFRSDFAGAALGRVKQTIEDYAQTSGLTRQVMAERHGSQLGDPARLAQALYRIAHDNEPPLRLPLGTDVAQQVLDKVNAVKAELERWHEVSVSTNFPSGE